ncbi:MAG: hypothetical protein Q7R52_01525 [archaeon]|nr:hypothetical protein [archaeon]
MSMDIDVYDFKETLKKFEDKDSDFLDFSDQKGVAVIEVGKTKNKAIDKKLMNMGYKVGERVLVVVQG